MNEYCRGCWWVEGGRCFADALGDVPTEMMPARAGVHDGFKIRTGFEVTPDHLALCKTSGTRTSKRTIMEKALAPFGLHPSDIWIASGAAPREET